MMNKAKGGGTKKPAMSKNSAPAKGAPAKGAPAKGAPAKGAPAKGKLPFPGAAKPFGKK